MDLYKQHKETEHKRHEALYNNLLLLSHFYPTSEEFKKIFHKDMFVKNNKAAFLEVIYYLLNIISPDSFKQKYPFWPLPDAKSENRFRTDVMQFINDLNSVYPYANIPPCHTSTLISPGGFRFVKFMLKISQFVLFRHLEGSDEINLLYPIKPHKNLNSVNDAQKKHLGKLTLSIDQDSKRLLQDFEEFYKKNIKEATDINCELVKLNQDIQVVQKEFNEVQAEFNKKYPLYQRQDSLQEKLTEVKKQVQKVVKLNHLFAHCEKLLKIINGTDLLLEHNEDNLTILEEVQHIIAVGRKLDLTQFFGALAVLLEKKSLELCDPPKECVESLLEMYERESIWYQDILKQLQLEEEQLKNHFGVLKDLLEDTMSENDTLAVPLPQTSVHRTVISVSENGKEMCKSFWMSKEYYLAVPNPVLVLSP